MTEQGLAEPAAACGDATVHRLDSQLGESRTIDACSFARERPRFGQLALGAANLAPADIEGCLQQQHQEGGKIGEILLARGLMDREQIGRVLSLQARWVANRITQLRSAELPRDVHLSLCLPAFNEATNIEDTLTAASAILPAFVERHEIVVVDDGSQDTTAERVMKFRQHDPRVRLVRHECNRGYGAAVATGLRSAQGNLIAFMDSDGQFCLLDLPQLLVRLDGHHAVIGYRHERADSTRRLLMAWAWNRALRLLFGLRVRDMDCAFKLFRREIIDQLHLNLTSPGINPEILIQFVRNGWRVCETPVMHYPRNHGVAAGCGWRMIVRALRELPQLGRYRFARDGASYPDTSPAISEGSHGLKGSRTPFASEVATEEISVATVTD